MIVYYNNLISKSKPNEFVNYKKENKIFALV